MKGYEIAELLKQYGDVEGVKVYHRTTGKFTEGKASHVARWCLELGYSFGEEDSVFHLINGYKLV